MDSENQINPTLNCPCGENDKLERICFTKRPKGETDFKVSDNSFTRSLNFSSEKIFAAERGLERIIVEVKSFLGQSFVTEFHIAMGQFDNYLIALEDKEPDRILYLAVPSLALIKQSLDDWTKEMATKGFPDLKKLYSTLGKPENVMLHRGEHHPHNYNSLSRSAFFTFLSCSLT